MVATVIFYQIFHFDSHALGKGFQTSIVANHLQFVTREDAHVTIGSIDANVLANDGSHHDTLVGRKVEFGKRATCPLREGGHHQASKVHIARRKTASKAVFLRTLLLSHHFALAKVVGKTTLCLNGTIFHPTTIGDQNHDAKGKGEMVVPREGREIFQYVKHQVGGDAPTHEENDVEKGASP